MIPLWISHVPEMGEDWSTKALTIETGSDDIHNIMFSPDGLTLASCLFYGGVCFWDTSTGAPRVVIAVTNVTFGRTAYSPDGRFLAYSRDCRHLLAVERVIGLWDAALQVVHGVSLDYSAQQAEALVFSPNGELLAVASDNMVEVLDTKTMALLRKMDHLEMVNRLAFSPSGQILAVVET